MCNACMAIIDELSCLYSKKIASYAFTVNTCKDIFLQKRQIFANCLQIRQQLLSDPTFGNLLYLIITFSVGNIIDFRIEYKYK